ncbi:MAG: UDP-N-acetylmuramate dehydrogenase [Candidatus Shapirobacteria bacterium]|nr:UDP-N-acetylmuramate dehydrogenase [Candidatus Shapirobacteria bacterium]
MINKNPFSIKTIKDFPLSKLTTFGIGGPAKLFCYVQTNEELIKVVVDARKKNLDFFILGGGSNILIADSGFPGLVIKTGNDKIVCQKNQITAQSGSSLANLVSSAIKNNLSGLECCLGIPGTVGGAIVGNAGAKDDWISKTISKVTVLNQNNQLQTLTNKQCQFDYRASRFQNSKEIIFQAEFNLEPATKKQLEKNQQKFLLLREKQPREKSAGSIFKNPNGNSAGQLIDQAGLKGKKINDAQISNQHANFIINNNHASAQDVLSLIRLIQGEVFSRFGVKLELEIRLIGFTKPEIIGII